MAANPHLKLAPDEYLTLERKAEHRSEYASGQMFAMAGGSETHNLLSGNLYVSLRNRLSSCRTYNSDMKVFLREERYCYPDVTDCCATPVFQDGERDVLLNPTVVCEVLSPSTMNYDLGDKSFYYRHNSSLRHILLIWHDRIRIDQWSRASEEDDWIYAQFEDSSQLIPLSELNLVLSVADVYEGVL